jgi:hypothetical protein
LFLEDFYILIENFILFTFKSLSLREERKNCRETWEERESELVALNFVIKKLLLILMDFV